LIRFFTAIRNRDAAEIQAARTDLEAHPPEGANVRRNLRVMVNNALRTDRPIDAQDLYEFPVISPVITMLGDPVGAEFNDINKKDPALLQSAIGMYATSYPDEWNVLVKSLDQDGLLSDSQRDDLRAAGKNISEEALARALRPVHTVGVELARMDVGKIPVPDHVRLFLQWNGQRFHFCVARIEEAELYARRVFREQREVDANPIPGSAERIRRSWPDSQAVFWHGHWFRRDSMKEICRRLNQD
jgi:hypothetical protein